MICCYCSKEFEKKFWNQKFCSFECSKESKREYYLKKNNIPCEICGFDKITERHHIIKRQDYGSDNPANLIQLCPNHHKMADSVRFEEEMKKIIFDKTGKTGELLNPEQIKAIEDELYEICRCGDPESMCRKNDWWWNSMKMSLISSGQFYQIARSVVNDKQIENKSIVEDSKIKE